MAINNSLNTMTDFETRQRKSIIFLLRPKASLSFLEEDSTIRQGLEKIKFHGYTALPVISESGKYVGTINEGDFLWFILSTKNFDIKKQEKYFIKDIIRKDWNPAVKIETTMDELVPRIMEQNFVPVIDDRGFFMGIITRKDVIENYYNLANASCNK